jgi:transmembrane sensor
MSANEDRVRSLITEQAADWFVANRAGLTAMERDSFSAWLKISPVHVEEYLALTVIARDLRAACEDSQLSTDALVERAKLDNDTAVQALPRQAIPPGGESSFHRPRWRAAAVVMAACAVLSFGLLAWWSLGLVRGVPSAPSLAYETRHGEQQVASLADGSVVHLNTDSTITVLYSKTERLVTVASGEADFEVAHDPERPFRVFARSAEVVALGTQFDVRLERDATVVTVVAGRVAVGPSPQLGKRAAGSRPIQAQPFVPLGANQQVTVTEGSWPVAPVLVDAQRTTAWLYRQIMFEHEPLERVASEFNRYSAKPIEITSPALRSLEISGVFATDDTQAFIAFLRSLEGVRVEVTATRILVSKD